MKIAFVFPPNWDPHSGASLPIWNREVTTRLSKTCDVLVYSGLFSHPRHDRVDGVQYRRFSTRLDRWIVNRFNSIHRRLHREGPDVYTDLCYILYAWKVALDLRKQDCDVVHVYYYPQLANLVKRFNPGVRVILNMHGEWLTQVKFTNLAARLRRLDMVISCAEFITKATAARFPQIANRCKTVPMGLSVDTLSRSYESPRRRAAASRRLLYMGRISPEKGIHILLDAFQLISQKYPDTVLTIVGPEWIQIREEGINLCLEKDVVASLEQFYTGSYLSQLKQRVTPELAKSVNFVGHVPYTDVPGYYENADIYVSPSLYESFGMSVIEAMAAGLPVVAARLKSFDDFISNERTGLLVESNNPSALADGVIRLFEDDGLRKSIACTAHESACEQFSWDTITSLLMQTYRETLDRSAPVLNSVECVRE